MLCVTVEPDGIALVVDAKDSRSHQLASPMTAPIRAMIYCVLDGAQVKAVQYEYVYLRRSAKETRLRLSDVTRNESAIEIRI
jgi:hypothetical protein